MKADRRKRLRAVGFRVGTMQEFLEISDEEMALIDLKVRMVEMPRKVRASLGMTQEGLAKWIGSSQSRVAKMEAGESDVSLDLICTALFALGISRREIGRTLSSKRAA